MNPFYFFKEDLMVEIEDSVLRQVIDKTIIGVDFNDKEKSLTLFIKGENGQRRRLRISKEDHFRTEASLDGVNFFRA